MSFLDKEWPNCHLTSLNGHCEGVCRVALVCWMRKVCAKLELGWVCWDSCRIANWKTFFVHGDCGGTCRNPLSRFHYFLPMIFPKKGKGWGFSPKLVSFCGPYTCTQRQLRSQLRLRQQRLHKDPLLEYRLMDWKHLW